jgi:hypothetical protein
MKEQVAANTNTYLDDVTVRVQCRVAVELHEHRLDQCGELTHRNLVPGALVGKLSGCVESVVR